MNSNSTTNKRKALGRLIRGMLIVLLLAFFFILFRSLGGPSLSSHPDAVFDDVVIGQTAMRRYNGRRVWVTRLSSVQRRQARELDSLLVNSKSGCYAEVVICAVSSSTERSGIELVYTDTAPTQLPGNLKWYGGFVDPVSGMVFDRLGRAYKGVRGADKVIALEVVE